MTCINSNPLLDFYNLPAFTRIRPEQVSPALDILLLHADKVIKEVTSSEIYDEWNAIIKPLEASSEFIHCVWSIVEHLNAVMDTPEMRTVHSENLSRVTSFFISLRQNSELYKKYKILFGSQDTFSITRKKILDDALRDFRLSGAELPEKDKIQFSLLQEKEAALAQTFSNHVLDSTDSFALFIENVAELDGLPESTKIIAKEAAERAGHKNSWKFTLHFPCYFSVMQYATHRSLRENMYRAYVTRASELGSIYGKGNSHWDNGQIMLSLLRLRREQAKMLGYRNFAEVSMATKMAESPQEVLKFLENLAERIRPIAEHEWIDLQQFSVENLGITDLAPWDINFATEKLREYRYHFLEEEVKQYFPEEKVLKGLFNLVNKLFNIVIVEDKADIWHPDVRFFKITSQNKVIANFYLDLYARDGKRSGAWMDSARGRHRRIDGTLQIPVAYLICNFSGPVGSKASLLSHNDIITLFHEFGHGLHHMLTQVDEISVSGINGVEGDAVEIPSQFMENFCWELEVLSDMSSHIEHGKHLPISLFDKMIAAKNFQRGIDILQQIVYAIFDIRLHMDFDPEDSKDINNLAREIHDLYHVISQEEFSRWPNSFCHIFAGGYAAGYYSYKWAEVLSSDLYEVFEEVKQKGKSIADPKTGMRYLHEILSVGGKRKAIESFISFRGRAPCIDAMLRHCGITKFNPILLTSKQ